MRCAFLFLKERCEARRFDLDPDRLRRTLGFLTHSGWLCWDERLFEGRVIVGQQWALDGIYTVLDRSRDIRVYQELRAAGGQFTRRQLHDWVWRGRYTEDEQRLLVSFMKAVDVCFELVPERDSWWREAVFNTFEHLPTSEPLGLRANPDGRKGAQVRAIEGPRLHKGHWHRILKRLASGTGPTFVQVFVSYTWDSERQEIPTNYEQPVDALCAALEGEPVRVLRDKTIIQGGDSITAFMQRVREVDRLIVVHSDKHWASPFCMYELSTALEELKYREKALPDSLVLVEHTNSGIRDGAAVAGYGRKWAKLKSIPTMLLEVTTPEKLRLGVGNLLLSDLPRIAALADRNRKGDDARAADLIAWVKERIGLPVPGSKA